MLVLGLLENIVTSIVKRLLLMDFNAPSYVCSAVSLVLGWFIHNIISQMPKKVFVGVWQTDRETVRKTVIRNSN